MSVTVLGELVVLTVTVPKFSVFDEKVTGALPVPLRVTTCEPASSVNVRVPLAAPTVMGENVTPTVQLAPAAMPEPQVLLEIEKPGVAAMLEKFRATV